MILRMVNFAGCNPRLTCDIMDFVDELKDPKRVTRAGLGEKLNELEIKIRSLADRL